jgi:hypothetical protein
MDDGTMPKMDFTLPNLDSLHLACCDVPPERVQNVLAMCDFLKLRSLKLRSMNGEHLQAGLANLMLGAAPTKPSLTELVLDEAWSTRTQAELKYLFLSSFNTLTSLTVRESLYGVEAAAVPLVAAITQHKNLSTLVLEQPGSSNNYLEPIMLASIAANLPHLRELTMPAYVKGSRTLVSLLGLPPATYGPVTDYECAFSGILVELCATLRASRHSRLTSCTSPGSTKSATTVSLSRVDTCDVTTTKCCTTSCARS